VSRLLETRGGLTYADAGVSIDAGDKAVAAIRADVASTRRPEVVGDFGRFAGMFRLAPRYVNPVLVASADGVGTKLEVARLLGRYETVGTDLVAMLVDDLVCLGAEPLFILDYVAIGVLDPAIVESVVGGVAAACRVAGAALLGGETAEHGSETPLDLAGFAVGVVEAGDELGPSRVRVGDAIVGLASPGLRSNGYTLARRALNVEHRLLEPAFAGASRSLGDELLTPSVIYAPAVLAMRRELSGAVRAAAHVTGGGIVGNVSRALPDHLDAVIDMTTFETPEIFFEVQRRGNVSADEMVRVFNCGLGMTVIVDASAAQAAVSIARAAGVDAMVVGDVVSGSGTVTLT
jgi:phosphoribosylformylglycinamidine cyclo-ligase